MSINISFVDILISSNYRENTEIEDGSIVDIPHTSTTIVADQKSTTFGIFGQYEIKMGKPGLIPAFFIVDRITQK